MVIRCRLNGRDIERDVDGGMTLLAFLRTEMLMTGTKEGCGRGDCGACTVVLDGQIVNACLVPLFQVNDKTVETIEGFEEDRLMAALRKSFVKHGAIQCGFCSPGMLIAVWSLLSENPAPTREQVRRGISGNLCRCTGYQAIIDAVMEVAALPKS